MLCRYFIISVPNNFYMSVEDRGTYTRQYKTGVYSELDLTTAHAQNQNVPTNLESYETPRKTLPVTNCYNLDAICVYIEYFSINPTKKSRKVAQRQAGRHMVKLEWERMVKHKKNENKELENKYII